MDFEEYTAPNGPWTEIDGWNQQGAFTSLRIINSIQRDRNIFGHVGEIGVHHGQFFFALALLTEIHECVERSFAIDVFDDQERNIDASGQGSMTIFDKNSHHILGFDSRNQNQSRNYHRGRFCHVVRADSLTLTSQGLAGLVDVTPLIGIPPEWDPRFRLFSIDGGHTVVHILNDLRFIEQVTVSGGVVIVDDFMHPKWPGVTEGLHIYCSDRGSRLVPFAYGNNKIYLTTFDQADQYQSAFNAIATADGVHCDHYKRVNLYGRMLTWVDFTAQDRA